MGEKKTKIIIRILAGIILAYNVWGLFGIIFYFKFIKSCDQCSHYLAFLPFVIAFFVLIIFTAFNLFFFKEWARKLIIILFLIIIVISSFSLFQKVPSSLEISRMLILIPISIHIFLVWFFLSKKTKQVFKPVK